MNNLFIFLLTLIFSNYAFCAVKIGYIQGLDPSDSGYNDIQDSVLVDFEAIVTASYYFRTYVADIEKVTCTVKCPEIPQLLKDFKDQGIKHIWSPIRFDNFTSINELLVEEDMVLWTGNSRKPGVCHSNIMYFGSTWQFVQQCIHF